MLTLKPRLKLKLTHSKLYHLPNRHKLVWDCSKITSKVITCKPLKMLLNFTVPSKLSLKQPMEFNKVDLRVHWVFNSLKHLDLLIHFNRRKLV